MSQADPRAVAKGIISGWYQSTEAAAGFTLGIAEHEWQRLEAIIAAVLADAERRGMERAAKMADDFDRLTCAEMERKYRLRIDVRRLNLGDNIARCIRAQAQADKEGNSEAINLTPQA